MSRSPIRLVLATICLSLVFGSPTASTADDAREFFRGKTLSYITSSRPGGGAEVYVRLIAKHLENHLPGAKVLVKNVPGAGGIAAANKIFYSAPDGLTFGGFNTGMIYSQLLRREGVLFDLREMSWIGKAASEPRTLVLGEESGYDSIEDVISSSLTPIFAGARITTAGFYELTILSKILGLHAKVVPNFRTPEKILGLIKGDFDGVFGTYSNFRQLVDEGHGFYAVQFGAREGGPGRGIPNAFDFVSSEIDRSVLRIMERMSWLGRLCAAPPGVPADRLAVLREAYMDALQDPGLIEEAARLKISISPADGEEVAKVVDSLLNPPVEAFRRFAELVELPVDSLDLRVRLDWIDEADRAIGFSTGDGRPLVYALDDSAVVSLHGEDTRLANLAGGDRCDIHLRIGDDVEVVELSCLR